MSTEETENTAREEVVEMAGLPQLPQGTPKWVYILLAIVPLLGGGGMLGFSFVSATDVQNELKDHTNLPGHIHLVEKVSRIEEDIDEIGDMVQVNFTNILLLCRAQDLNCITK